MNTRNGERVTSERKKVGTGKKFERDDGKAKKTNKKSLDNGDTSSPVRRRSTRILFDSNSSESSKNSKESTPVKRKSGKNPETSPEKKSKHKLKPLNGSVTPSKNTKLKKGTTNRNVKSKPKTKYFRDVTSSEEESENEEVDVEHVDELPPKNINNNDIPTKIPSRRSSRLSSVASSTTSSALSSLLSTRMEKKERKGLIKDVDGNVNGNSESEEEYDEYEQAIEVASPKKRSKSSKKKAVTEEDEYEQAIKVASPKKVSKVPPPKKQSKAAAKISATSQNVEPEVDVNFQGYNKQVSLLCSLIRSALTHVESNTVLVVGSRGVGKSALIDHCLKKENANSKSVIVRLHGFIETDEGLAFKSINKQLENVATASHTIPALMELLIQEERDQGRRKPFIILLDKFDIFCRKNQSLLYNLFDLTRKCKHVLVIGSTTRIEAPELLEKRVKSRMNQIMIHLASPFEKIDDYILFTTKLLQSKHGMDSLPDEWLIPLKQLYSRTASIRELNKFIIQQKFLSSLPTLPPSQPSQSQSSQGIGRDRFDLTTGYLTSLSNLELAVLVSVFKSCKGRKVDSFICSTVIKLAAALPSHMVHDRSMLFKVINNLIDFGFFVLTSPVTAHSTSYMTERTELSLNIDERTLKQSLVSIQNSIPSSLKSLLTL